MLDKITCLRILFILYINFYSRFTGLYCFFLVQEKFFTSIKKMGKDKKRSRERDKNDICEKQIRRLERVAQSLSDTVMKAFEKGKLNFIVINLSLR